MTKVTSAHPLEICLCRDERFSTALPNKLQPEDLETDARTVVWRHNISRIRADGARGVCLGKGKV